VTYAAHATAMGGRDKRLSGDYPGRLSAALEADPRVEMATFCAGGVGSHSQRAAASVAGYQKVIYIAQGLSRRVLGALDTATFRPARRLVAAEVPLDFGALHLRVARGYELKPWFFEKLLGTYASSLTALRLGDVLFAGFPADVSGEFSDDLARRAGAGLHVVPTSFNGGYVGYLTPSKHYDLPAEETRRMNFTGPEGGEMAVDLAGQLLERLSEE
ncbi:MAG: hypothetical protein WBA12_12990, partial [Catalinimonas sp.]